MTPPLAINGRFRVQALSGVQRVAQEVVKRLRSPHVEIRAPRGAVGLPGHLWEQTILPIASGSALLWSPCNAGPVAARRHVVTIHDAAVLDHPEWFSPRFAGVYRWLWPRLAERAKIVTVSEFSRARLAERLALSPEAIGVAPNGVDPRFAPAPAEAVAALRESRGLGEAPYFLTLSTLEPRKNLALVLRAWAAAGPRLGDALLLVAGGANQRVFAQAQELPVAENVVFTGRIPDEELPALITGARAVLYPSLYEGFGLPVLEAMACGRPVATTRRASLPEVGGDAALYVDHEDEADLAALLVKLLEDDEAVARHGRAGLERASQFTWDRAAAAMEAIFAEQA